MLIWYAIEYFSSWQKYVASAHVWHIFINRNLRHKITLKATFIIIKRNKNSVHTNWVKHFSWYCCTINQRQSGAAKQWHVTICNLCVCVCVFFFSPFHLSIYPFPSVHLLTSILYNDSIPLPTVVCSFSFGKCFSQLCTIVQLKWIFDLWDARVQFSFYFQRK